VYVEIEGMSDELQNESFDARLPGVIPVESQIRIRYFVILRPPTVFSRTIFPYMLRTHPLTALAAKKFSEQIQRPRLTESRVTIITVYNLTWIDPEYVFFFKLPLPKFRLSFLLTCIQNSSEVGSLHRPEFKYGSVIEAPVFFLRKSDQSRVSGFQWEQIFFDPGIGSITKSERIGITNELHKRRSFFV
jgi:hypothetical protein